MNWNKNPPPPGVNPQYSSHYYNSNRYEADPPRQDIEEYAHKPGRPGGGWDVEEAPQIIRPSGQNRPEVFARPPQPFREVPEPVHHLPERYDAHVSEHKPTLAVSEQAGIYETVLVNDITTPGGVRPRPLDKDMNEFISKCKYLSPEIIIDLLCQQLENSQSAFVRYYLESTLCHWKTCLWIWQLCWNHFKVLTKY